MTVASVRPLPPEALYRRCTLDHLDFTTTADLKTDIEFIGQERPIAAIELGVTIDRHGYNIFALGPSGLGKYTWSSVPCRSAPLPNRPLPTGAMSTISQPSTPRALRLPNGMGRQFATRHGTAGRRDADGLSAAFESEEYRTRRRTVEEEFQDIQQASLDGAAETG